MFKFSEEELDNAINNFASLFEYDYAHSIWTVPEGKAVTILFYNSPSRHSFDVEISYDESTYIETIVDAIIEAYERRLP